MSSDTFRLEWWFPSFSSFFVSLPFSFLREIGKKCKMSKGEKVHRWLNLQGLSVSSEGKKQPNCAATRALPAGPGASQRPFKQLPCHHTVGSDARYQLISWQRWAKSQDVVVIQQLRVLTAFPQAKQAEVKVHLNHLFSCNKKSTKRKQG